MVLLSKYGNQPRRVLSGALTLLLDLRWMPEKAEPALRRSEYGALICMGATKHCCRVRRSWCWRCSRADGSAAEKWLLLLILPAGLLVYLGRTVWHGGLCLNLRYLLPVLPVLSVATAPVLLRLWDRLTAKRAVLLGVALSIVLLVLGLSLERKIEVIDELLILWTPSRWPRHCCCPSYGAGLASRPRCCLGPPSAGGWCRARAMILPSKPTAAITIGSRSGAF